jgi:hypothetical protein
LFLISNPNQANQMSQDTGKFRKNTNDQFYTKQTVAKNCIQHVLEQCPNAQTYLWIEPSAGNGAFLKQVPASFEAVGLDIEPKDSGILKHNFLDWKPATSKDCLVFGNPPFGRQSSMAKQFIKHCAEFAKLIAFILPLSFEKPSMNKVFPANFHCIFSQRLPEKSFEINGHEYDVPCVFQIWEKKNTARQIPDAVKEAGFQYVKSTENYDIAFRRVGVYAGKSFARGQKEFSPQSHYFIQLNAEFKPHTEKILENMNKHQFPTNTVGPRSISKPEANSVMNQILQNLSS